MPLKISHVAFCETFVEECDGITCSQCKDIFNAIKLAEEKFNSALRQPTAKGSEPSVICPYCNTDQLIHVVECRSCHRPVELKKYGQTTAV